MFQRYCWSFSIIEKAHASRNSHPIEFSSVSLKFNLSSGFILRFSFIFLRHHLNDICKTSSLQNDRIINANPYLTYFFLWLFKSNSLIKLTSFLNVCACTCKHLAFQFWQFVHEVFFQQTLVFLQ